MEIILIRRRDPSASGGRGLQLIKLAEIPQDLLILLLNNFLKATVSNGGLIL